MARRSIPHALAWLLLAVVSLKGSAEPSAGADRPDAASAAAIATAPGELPASGPIYACLRALASDSERVHLEVLGTTEEGARSCCWPLRTKLGVPASSPDITGGIGWQGLANLDEFLRAGGLLIALGNGSTLVLDSGFVRNVRRSAMSRRPGRTCARFMQPRHPVAYGYPEVTPIFRSPYAFYDPPRCWLTMSYCTSGLDGPLDPRHVVLQWGTRPFPGLELPAAGADQPALLSGGGRNPEALQGRPAILDIPVGRGHVLASDFNPMHRDMNRADYRTLWNAILDRKDIVEAPEHS